MYTAERARAAAIGDKTPSVNAKAEETPPATTAPPAP